MDNVLHAQIILRCHPIVNLVMKLFAVEEIFLKEMETVDNALSTHNQMKPEEFVNKYHVTLSPSSTVLENV